MTINRDPDLTSEILKKILKNAILECQVYKHFNFLQWKDKTL